MYPAAIAAGSFIWGYYGLEAISSALPSPDHPGQEPEPKSEGEGG
jgi:hypothetical protein